MGADALRERSVCRRGWRADRREPLAAALSWWWWGAGGLSRPVVISGARMATGEVLSREPLGRGGRRNGRDHGLSSSLSLAQPKSSQSHWRRTAGWLAVAGLACCVSGFQDDDLRAASGFGWASTEKKGWDVGEKKDVDRVREKRAIDKEMKRMEGVCNSNAAMQHAACREGSSEWQGRKKSQVRTDEQDPGRDCDTTRAATP